MVHKWLIIAMALMYMSKFSGTTYRWGGDNAIEGFDCSGLVMEYLKVLGTMSEAEDRSAAGIYNKLITLGYLPIIKPKTGCLVFYHNDNRSVRHVGIYMGLGYVFSASSGDSSTVSSAVAASQGAFVKLRRLKESNAQSYIMPLK